MIAKKVIDELYKKYRQRPSGVEDLDIGLLFDYAWDHHNLEINENGCLVINSVDEASPFHTVNLSNVHGITLVEDSVAIVLHSSIIFLSKETDEVNVHLRLEAPSIWERVRMKMVD